MHLLSPPPSDQTGSAGRFLSQGLNHSAGRGVRAAGGVIKASQTGRVLGPAVEVPSPELRGQEGALQPLAEQPCRDRGEGGKPPRRG